MVEPVPMTPLMAAGPLAQRIAAIIAPTIADLGFELVRIQMTGTAPRILQIMAERPDGTMRVEDCEELSHAVSALLDVEDPIQGEYNLEVSSPGMARPLTRPKDFERWAGFEAKIELSEPLAERRRFKGRLAGFQDDEVLIEIPVDGYDEPQIIGLPFALLADAKLVIDDAMIRTSLKKPA